MRLSFGECVMDLGTREVFRSGSPATISPKAFQLLEVLIDRHPNAVSKQDLHGLLWPDTFVSDANLPNLVRELRAALRDDAKEPRLIRTVPKFGYAFAGEVVPEGSPRLLPSELVYKLIWKDREIALAEGENILGREREAAAWIDVHSVSRHHARIVVSGDTATIEDLGSKNGTFLAGESVVRPRALRDGDRIRIGTVEMIFRRYVGGISTESVRSR
ncbi:MAG TPA: FHA domain-containing protein [Thermoanaerobaculia bacterium]